MGEGSSRPDCKKRAALYQVAKDMAACDAIQTHVFQNDLRVQIERDWPLEQPQEGYSPTLCQGLEPLSEGGHIARHFEQDVHPITVCLRTHSLDDIHLQGVEHPGGAHGARRADAATGSPPTPGYR